MAYYDPISGFGFDIFTTLNAIGYVNGNRLPGYAFR